MAVPTGPDKQNFSFFLAEMKSEIAERRPVSPVMVFSVDHSGLASVLPSARSFPLPLFVRSSPIQIMHLATPLASRRIALFGSFLPGGMEGRADKNRRDHLLLDRKTAENEA